MSADVHAYGYLTEQEARFLDAAAARLIPADDLGPGARLSPEGDARDQDPRQRPRRCTFHTHKHSILTGSVRVRRVRTPAPQPRSIRQFGQNPKNAI